MSLAYRSVAVESAIEFINLQPLDINPLMSKCEIKVFYLGDNRNKSSISKEVAAEMAKTLRGSPIVGQFKSDKDDFSDHGKQVIIDSKGVHFTSLTIPYGFVSPDANVWFAKFQEANEKGEIVEREYLMTTGYIWTGQFEEAKKIFENGGRPQSMELDQDSLQGTWQTDRLGRVEYFIISDAVFSSLCVLGEDVEPCFEGAGITAPEISRNFSLDNQFKNTLFSMMKDLEQVLKGEYTMPEEKKSVETIEVEATQTEVAQDEKNLNSVDNSVQSVQDKNYNVVEEENSIQEEVNEVAAESANVNSEESLEITDGESEPSEAAEVDFALDINKYNELIKANEDLLKKVEELTFTVNNLQSFKKDAEDKAKDDLISKFSMLSDEDKADVIAHKADFTLEEIESKLAVIGFRKGVNFNLEEKVEESVEAEPAVTFSLNDVEDSSIPEWVKAVKENQ